MFEQAFKNIDDVLWKEAGCTTELDYTEQTSWLLFLKYLDGLEQDKAAEAGLASRKYSFILAKDYRWESWAAPKDKKGQLDHNKAKTGDDLRDFVNGKLFPYLHGFKQKASGPNTLEYKIGEIFGEIKNKISSGYNLREIIDHIDELRFRSQTEKHELSHLYEAKIRNMGNAGRNGGEYYTPRPLIRAMVQVVNPKIGERIYDGACGSAGFLCESFDYLKAKKLTTKELKTLQERTFHGNRSSHFRLPAKTRRPRRTEEVAAAPGVFGSAVMPRFAHHSSCALSLPRRSPEPFDELRANGKRDDFLLSVRPELVEGFLRTDVDHGIPWRTEKNERPVLDCIRNTP